VNRTRGRIGFEYSSLTDRSGAGLNSYETGLVFRGDMTRIGGTYWNLSGYSRVRLTSRSGGDQTLNDLLNRTYTLSLTYNNPGSSWVAGFGRFYLPWAPSLSTIDGGYVGRRISPHATAGIFAGSTPDPTSWNYNPNRQEIGAFMNFEGGSYDAFHYTVTPGLAFSRVHWRPERQFAFFESAFSYKRYLSVYHDLEVDRLSPSVSAANGLQASRSFVTLRFRPVSFLDLDLSHNYFHDTPTFDPRLIGTGLLDKFLFQGVSGGFRVRLPYSLEAYTNFGRSNRSGDASNSLNQMYGIAANRLWRARVHADFRYSHFNSAFGAGQYKSVTLWREVGEDFRLELEGGQQNYVSSLSQQTRARYVTGRMDWFFTRNYFLGAGLTTYRGQVQNYNQVFLNLGYRF
jgi:hypothetical protein